MTDEITADERVKRVVDEDGREIGIVDSVNDGTAYVDPNPDITGELKSKLGWGADEQSTYPLRHDAIDTITAEKIRLRVGSEQLDS